MTAMDNPDGEICADCGRPALGLAYVNDDRLCHPNDPNQRDCYSLRELGPLNPPTPVERVLRQARQASVRDLCARLKANVDWIAGRPEADQFLDEIRDVVVSTTRAIDRPRERKFMGPCAECAADLYGFPEKTIVECQKCGQAHDVAERADWLDGIAMEMLVPLDQLRDYAKRTWNVTPSRQLLYSWKTRGRLVSKGKDRDGQELFRVGDFKALAVKEAA